ncbi:pirin [Lactiplantibacillus pentosus]|uniref:Pirin n=1 Tax=Lactiplantibacillus pentosus TaxID=1589 RepID=A0ABX5D043_LACPE|nr:pirin [Lactiplantibacillus pentosus]
MFIKNIGFNSNYFKTWSFWLGILTVVGLIGDPILHYHSSTSPWLPILIAILLFVAAFTKKNK